MIGLLCFTLAVLASPFKSKLRLEAENAALRHQLIVLPRKLRGRVRLANSDRMFFVQLYRWFPSILQVLAIIRPETLIHWHRSGSTSQNFTDMQAPRKSFRRRAAVDDACPIGLQIVLESACGDALREQFAA